MWFNNVETKPGIGYPKAWEDQDHYRGGWERRDGKLELKSGSRANRLLNLFHNPYQPTLEDYYEPWTYDYETLSNSPERKHQPVARAHSTITGDPMEIEWGPNWEDDLAGAHETGMRDPDMKGLEESIRMDFEQAFMMYLPRICEHCLNPSCVSSCPSGAMYKREEDGIVLVDQEACKAWRHCVTSCPYKKVYFNWGTHKAEKCTMCFPRIEAGMPTICSETCVGRIRYMGLLLYDADRVEEAASVEAEDQLYEAQLGIFLDPDDPEVAAAAREAGIPEPWLEAARRSPVYQMAVDWKIALPLHPEYRTLPMVWYVPPLSPIMQAVEGKGSEMEPEAVFPGIDEMRIPIRYLANLLSAGDEEVIRHVLKKMAAMRLHMRAVSQGKQPKQTWAQACGLDEATLEAMYRLLAIAKYDDRFVIPPTHREQVADLLAEQGSCGLDFAGGPGACVRSAREGW